MEAVLTQVQNGEFAREWIAENQAGRPSYTQLRAAEQDLEIEAVGEELRGLFAWEESADGGTESADGDEESTEVTAR